MKRLFYFWMLILCQIIFIKPVFASSEMYGVYIAPRIGFHYTTLFDINVIDSNSSISLDSYKNFIIRGGLGIGYDFSKRFDVPMRSEVEFLAVNKMRETLNVSSTDLSGTLSPENKMYSLFFNTYYDFHNESKFTPYVGLGIGGFFTKITAVFALEDNDGNFTGSFPVSNAFNFSCNASTGISYSYNKYINFDALYRIAYYTDANSSYNGQNRDLNLNANLLMNQIFLIARLTF